MLLTAYHEASALLQETQEKYLAAKKALAMAAQENEKACQDLYDCVCDLFESVPRCASSAKELLEFVANSPYELQEWVHNGGDVAELLGRISEALTTLHLAIAA